ncbi:ABC transporter substrate-binding protein [Nitratireductor rhodophyticola]|uniref:ABC transporter substrate-binding protein n=1 Tax=Nitratireductor rhodophyticola TaxID=2854036 RepID=UPI002AC924E1|nr:ABC transporter substrate-binding protein [Nitratireductor rhodophyticola]MEC9243793.1 ABC transporter substrate-binding protein [Pseudomonadota bacterium]WPZ15100.1 ABC transporter substrate-binding protein [Nitratireductor rhodophyticola]
MFLAAALLAATALSPLHTVEAAAETVLRLDEVAVGELDPGKASDYADSILMFNVYDTLVLPIQGGPGYAPHLAESWEMDGTDFVFKLRSDVAFQSGNPLTAEDVVFSFERMKALGQGLSFLFEKVEGAEAIDEHTVRFKLTEAYSPFIASLVRLPIVDKKLVMENLGDGEGEMKDWGQAFLSANSAGTGAYKVSSHNPQEETVMQKNADYFLGVPDAAPDTVRLRYGLEAATVRTLIAQGEHDISSQWLPPEVMKALAANGAQLFTETGGGGFYIKMNTAKAPLDDANCRLALAKAYDYATGLAMVAITDGVAQGSPSTGAIPAGMFGANPADQTLQRDVEAAKQHLAECKYDPSEFTLEISWIGEVPIEERFALLMQANFAEIGIKSEIRKIPWALFTEQVTNPETTPHISQIFANAVTGDPDTLLYPMYHSSVRGTWQSPEYLDDEQVDAALDKGRKAAAPEEREAAYSQLNDRLMEIAPTIYAYDRQSVFAASDRVKVPALQDPAKAFGLDGMGFSFRLMEMTGQ